MSIHLRRPALNLLAVVLAVSLMPCHASLVAQNADPSARVRERWHCVPGGDPQNVVFLPDGKSVIAQSRDRDSGEWTLWHVPLDGAARKLVSGRHLSNVHLSHDGKLLWYAEGDWARSIVTKACCCVIETGAVTEIPGTRDEYLYWLASAAASAPAVAVSRKADVLVREYDARGNAKKDYTFAAEYASTPGLSPDAKLLAWMSKTRITVVDVKRGKELLSLAGPADDLMYKAWTAFVDSGRVLSAYYTERKESRLLEVDVRKKTCKRVALPAGADAGYSCCVRGKVLICHTVDRERTMALDVDDFHVLWTVPGRADLSPDGKVLISAEDDGVFAIYDMPAFDELCQRMVQPARTFFGSQPVLAGSALWYVGSKSIERIDVDTGAVTAIHGAPFPDIYHNQVTLWGCCNGSHVAFVTPSGCEIWSADPPHKCFAINGDGKKVGVGGMSPDGTRALLFSAPDQSSCRALMVETDTGKEVWSRDLGRPYLPGCGTFSPDGSRCVINTGEVCVYDTATGEPSHRFRQLNGTVTWALDGQSFLLTSPLLSPPSDLHRETIRLGSFLARTYDLTANTTRAARGDIGAFLSTTGETSGDCGLSVVFDGLCSAVLDVRTGKVRHLLPNMRLQRFATSADRTMIAVGSEDRQIRVFRLPK